MKRILFLMSDTGGGHRAAAEAMIEALNMRYPGELQMEMVDVFRNYTRFPYTRMPEFYPWLINNSKSSWGAGYRFSNTRARARALSTGFYNYSESRLKQMIRQHPTDLVVNVHSVLARPCMEAYSRVPGERPPYTVVVTDLVSTHYFWYDRRAERTLVPTQEAYDRGIKAGLKPEQMRITGLPVHPKFAEKLKDKAAARAELGWDPDLPAILMVGGGDGMGPLFKTSRAINARNLKCQIAIIAGRNKQLKDNLDTSEWNQPTHTYSFVTNMPLLMAAADILVTKGGPATLCEACIARVPSIIYDAIPGQETGNVEWIVNNNAGVFAPTPRGVADTVAAWLGEGAEGLARRSAAAAALGKPNAVWEIAEELYAYAHHAPIVNPRRRLLPQLDDMPGAKTAKALARRSSLYLSPLGLGRRSGEGRSSGSRRSGRRTALRLWRSETKRGK
jgi:1,2-diacylglycerol 3-beta-galactosyltransferase